MTSFLDVVPTNKQTNQQENRSGLENMPVKTAFHRHFPGGSGEHPKVGLLE